MFSELFSTPKYVLILQDKKILTLGPDDHLHVEGFALNVFAKADKQDRAGRADMYQTSQNSHSASVVMVLSVCKISLMHAKLILQKHC